MNESSFNLNQSQQLDSTENNKSLVSLDKKYKVFFKLILAVFLTIIFIFIYIFFQSKRKSTSNVVFFNESVKPSVTKSPKIRYTLVGGLRIYEDSRLVINDIDIDKDVISVVPPGHPFSHDYSKITYKKKSNTNLNIESLYIYDTTTNKTQKLYETKAINSILWSPNDKYILINSGSGLIRIINIFDISGNTINSFYTYNPGNSEYIPCSWINDDELFCNQLQVVKTKTTLDGRIGRSITKISLKGENVYLKEADLFNDYNFLKFYEQTVYFKKITVNKKEDWYGNEKVTFWKMDIDGNNLIEVSEYEATV